MAMPRDGRPVLYAPAHRVRDTAYVSVRVERPFAPSPLACASGGLSQFFPNFSWKGFPHETDR
jgi:hypothetical protein